MARPVVLIPEHGPLGQRLCLLVQAGVGAGRRPLAGFRIRQVQHLRLLGAAAGEVVRQGEDLGRWVQSVRLGWEQLTGVRQWMREPVLGIGPAAEDEKPKPRPTQVDKRIANLAAAGQFFEREGHLTVPRKHVGTVLSKDGGERRFRPGHGSTTSGAGPPYCPRSERSSCPGSGWSGHLRCSCGTWVSLSGRGSGSQT
ncbi:hypothetical protein AMK15_33870 [Streptomyces sp. MJM1172]|nr:hypothetical protein AMK15_33870 [Streptomyces sp. MJM1172]